MTPKNLQRQVFQFKVMLKDTHPPIWRRICVPSMYTFWDLHVALQDAMGWQDCHLHWFRTLQKPGSQDIYIGIPDPDGWSEETRKGWETKIADWFSLGTRPKMNYEYDFGDSWEHLVTLEKVYVAQAGERYPVCVKGRGACPPEDCGGLWGFYNFCDAMSDPQHKDHVMYKEWWGDTFDPKFFNPDDVVFDDPQKRLKYFLEEGEA